MAFLCKKCHDQAEGKSRELGNPNPHSWYDHVVVPGTKIGITYCTCDSCKAVGDTVECQVY